MASDRIAYAAIASLLAAILTAASLRWWIGRAAAIGLVGRDMNKPGEAYAAEAGGVWVTFSVAFSLLAYAGLAAYVDGDEGPLKPLAAMALLLFMSSFLGFLDDILGWRKGIRAIYRIVYMAPLSLPLVALRLGSPVITVPFIGEVNLGVLFNLVLVPIGVVGASNGFNMLAGYNGLEAGMGLALMLSSLAVGAMRGDEVVVALSLVMASSLAVFLAYNWYPARVFPGNSLTYGLGAYYAGLVVLGKFVRLGVSFFALYFVELLLFVRGLAHGVYKQNFGRPQPDGSLLPPYDKCYSLTHVAIKALTRLRGRATERGVVAFILALQLAVILASFAAYAAGLPPFSWPTS
ncbi:MAG: glycosyltransferase 4 family protein [Desulfurococcaceae archaeon]